MVVAGGGEELGGGVAEVDGGGALVGVSSGKTISIPLSLQRTRVAFLASVGRI